MSDSGIAATSSRVSVTRLVRPRSIAVVGASASAGSLGGIVLKNLQRFGFAGQVYPVNPTRSEIDGRPCFHSVDELPMGVDCAVLAIPRTGVLEVVSACARRGVGGLVIFSAGFAEAGKEGQALQQQIAQIAAASDMAMSGPNCLGLINFVDGIPLSFSPGVVPMPRDSRPGLGLLSQSGAMATVLRTQLAARDIRISFAISTGNEAVNGVQDFLDFLIDDDSVQAIVMIVEQFRRPKRFLELARKAREVGKTIVLLHPGRSVAARISAQTHTGALAGDYDLMRTLVLSEGVAMVDTLDELIDVAELCVRCPAPQGGAAVITESGAHKALVLDLADGMGLPLPPLSPVTEAALRGVLPDFIPASNPLDVTAHSLVDPSLFRNTMGPILADKKYGSLMVSMMLNSPAMSKGKVPLIVDALKELHPDKAVILSVLGEPSAVPAELVGDLRAAGGVFFGSPDRAVRALARLTECALRRVPRVSLPSKDGKGTTLPQGVVPEYRSKQILAEAGIAVPRGEFVCSEADALQAASRIGYPVALKAQAAALSHKSDAGGVALRIGDAQALSAAWAKMHADIARARPGLVLDGVLVETMAPAGLELILGARNDRDWGPVLMIGLGGVLAEAMQDVRLLPPDLAPEGIAAEIRRLKGAALLGDFRGRPALDVEALAELASRLGAFIVARPEIGEIDINPVMLYPKGKGAVAVDALMVTR